MLISQMYLSLVIDITNGEKKPILYSMVQHANTIHHNDVELIHSLQHSIAPDDPQNMLQKFHELDMAHVLIPSFGIPTRTE
jgi:hypothetical protein